MDPGRAESRPDERANLRSRGDGPNPKMPITQDIVKPPLTRRWTPRRRGQRGPHRQTSAHAEMDPSWTVFRPARKTNLRSRGDGPVANAILLDSYRKPPLTRRWTGYSSCFRSQRQQTSAHAEMDHLAVLDVEHILANLRSRGDGPTALFLRGGRVFKPPLTRRWTSRRRHRPKSSNQTSAHAEMDPSPVCAGIFYFANLRSRGDGPLTYYVANADAVKPPLTRRWTNKPGLSITYMGQTSAHAEMDPTTRRTTPTVFPNLRSRGDGPALLAFGALRSGKPPLTRG